MNKFTRELKAMTMNDDGLTLNLGERKLKESQSVTECDELKGGKSGVVNGSITKAERIQSKLSALVKMGKYDQKKPLEENLKDLINVRDIQCKDEQACLDEEYFMGMANGLILAVSIMTNTEPKFKEKKK